ncbi:DUF6461 domain-containing protein [Kitasatospora azatica]|uniref:DUF6461 domain-containing protein n=1 Tax=Kitasatospora azatica TaxID=58347 RepID=UPI00068CA85A|nr:DUF6461 domain-containing protein [Kitasatospora azatica]
MDVRDGRFDWVDEEDGFYPILTLIEGVAEDEVIKRFGGDLEAARLLTADEIYDLQPRHGHSPFVSVGTANGVLFALEVVGSTGAVPRVLRDLSRGGRCFGLLLDVNGGDRVHYAVDGDLVVYQEPRGTLTPLRAGDSRWSPAWYEGLSDATDPAALCGSKLFLLTERVMQTVIEPAWFTQPLRTVELPDTIRFINTPAWDIP